MSKQIDVQKEVEKKLAKQHLEASIKEHRKLIKTIGKNLKINPMEVEYFVTEMGYSMIVATMQGYREKTINVMEDNIKKNPLAVKIQGEISKIWEENNTKKSKGLKVVKK